MATTCVTAVSRKAGMGASAKSASPHARDKPFARAAGSRISAACAPLTVNLKVATPKHPWNFFARSLICAPTPWGSPFPSMAIARAALQALIFRASRNPRNACKKAPPISRRLFRCHIQVLHFLFFSPQADVVPEAAPPVRRTFVKVREKAKLDHERPAQTREARQGAVPAAGAGPRLLAPGRGGSRSLQDHGIWGAWKLWLSPHYRLLDPGIVSLAQLEKITCPPLS